MSAAAFIPPDLENYLFISPSNETAWIGLDKRTNENVMIRIRERKNLSDSDLSLLTAEIALLKQITNPIVAKLHEVVDHENFLFFILDPPKSKSMREFINEKGPVRETKAQEFLGKYVEIIEDLSEGSTRNMALTIDSIFVDDDCNVTQVYVAYQESIFSNQFDVQFLAPEVINQRQYGPPASVWCAGVLLYFMTIGKLPFGGDNAQEVERNVLNSHPHMPNSITGRLTALLVKMLTKNPRTRISMPAIVDAPWMATAPDDVRFSLARLDSQKHRSGLGQSLLVKSATNFGKDSLLTKGPASKDSILKSSVGFGKPDSLLTKSSAHMTPLASGEARQEDDKLASPTKGSVQKMRLTPRKAFVPLAPKQQTMVARKGPMRLQGGLPGNLG